MLWPGVWIELAADVLRAVGPSAAPATTVSAVDELGEELPCAPAAADCRCDAAPVCDHGAAPLGWFLAGIAFWPFLDVARLAKLAWLQRVAAAERHLRARAPAFP